MQNVGRQRRKATKPAPSAGKRRAPRILGPHRQAWIKTNVPVDAAIAPLVSALSAWPQLRTIESCQGGLGGAWVCFEYGETWNELADFVLGRLGPRLAKQIGDRAGLSLHVCPSGRVQGELAVRRGALRLVNRALRSLSGQHSGQERP